MKNIEFDEDNFWHKNAHLVFGFQCDQCDLALGYGDVPGHEPEGDFLEFCIAVSELAKEQGWKLINDFTFRCPKCSAK